VLAELNTIVLPEAYLAFYDVQLLAGDIQCSKRNVLNFCLQLFQRTEPDVSAACHAILEQNQGRNALHSDAAESFVAFLLSGIDYFNSEQVPSWNSAKTVMV
jgi:hypothetical protein